MRILLALRATTFYHQPYCGFKRLTDSTYYVTITPPWKVSGVCSRTNRSIIAGMQQGKRLCRTLQSTSIFSITGKEGRPDSGSCHLPLLNDGSIKNGWQHERFGVHY